MLYDSVKGTLLELLRAPHGPPEAPVGSPDSVQIFRASPRFLRMRVLLHFLSITPAIFIELALVFAERTLELPGATAYASVVALVLTAAVALLRYFLIRLDYDMRYYVVTDRCVRIRRGALTVQESTYTFANVQNLAIRQGPLERLFDISNLHIETAGGGLAAQADQNAPAAHQAVLAGIDNAPEVRDRIRGLLKAYRDAGLGDREDDRHGPSGTLGRSGRGGRHPAEFERLREILQELRALKAALDR